MPHVPPPCNDSSDDSTKSSLTYENKTSSNKRTYLVNKKTRKRRLSKICEVCGDRFALQNELNTHYLSDHIYILTSEDESHHRYYYCCKICWEIVKPRIDKRKALEWDSFEHETDIKGQDPMVECLQILCRGNEKPQLLVDYEAIYDGLKPTNKIIIDKNDIIIPSHHEHINNQDSTDNNVNNTKCNDNTNDASDKECEIIEDIPIISTGDAKERDLALSSEDEDFLSCADHNHMYDLSSTDTHSIDSSLDSIDASCLFPSLNELAVHNRTKHAEIISSPPRGGHHARMPYLHGGPIGKKTKKFTKKLDKVQNTQRSQFSCSICSMTYDNFAELSGHQARNHSRLLGSKVDGNTDTGQKSVTCASNLVCALNPNFNFSTSLKPDGPILSGSIANQVTSTYGFVPIKPKTTILISTETISSLAPTYPILKLINAPILQPKTSINNKATKLTARELLRTPDYFEHKELKKLEPFYDYKRKPIGINCPLKSKGYTDCTKRFCNSTYLTGHIIRAHPDYYANLLIYKAKYGEHVCYLLKSSLKIDLNLNADDINDNNDGNLEPGEILENPLDTTSTAGRLLKNDFCVSCGIQYKNRKAFFLHVEEVHKPDEKIWSCPHCTKSYHNKSHLIRHMPSTSHAYERPYKCPICLKRFTRHFDLKFHLISMFYHKDPTTLNLDHIDKSSTESCSLKYICHLCTPAQAYLPPGWTFQAYATDINDALLAHRRERANFEKSYYEHCGVHLNSYTNTGGAKNDSEIPVGPLDRKAFWGTFSPYSPITLPSFDPATVTVEALAKLPPIKIIRFGQLDELINHYLAVHPDFDPRLLEDDGVPQNREGPILGTPVRLLPPFLTYVKNVGEN